jgi:hypothetical protein
VSRWTQTSGRRNIAAALRALTPHAPGGGRAALILPMWRLPDVAWKLELAALDRPAPTGVVMTDELKAAAREDVVRRLRALGPASAALAQGDDSKDWLMLGVSAPCELEVA